MAAEKRGPIQHAQWGMSQLIYGKPDGTLKRDGKKPALSRQPKGWKPKTELENFGRCQVCGEVFDCRDLDQVLNHLHGGKVEMVEIFGPPTRRT